MSALDPMKQPEEITEALSRFLQFADKGYVAVNAFRPADLAEAGLLDVLKAFVAAGDKEREQIAGVIKRGIQAYFFSMFALRCASFAIQTKVTDHLAAGLYALTVDRDRLDSRDVVGNLGVLNDASNRLGTDLWTTVQSGLRAGTPQRQKIMADFFRNPDACLGIKALGFEIAHINGLPWYRANRGSIGTGSI
jgi:hypothetical protein